MAETMTAVERLEQLLNEKDAKIEELQERAQEAEEKAEQSHEWTRHRVYEDPKAAPSPDLPVPRLEVRWVEQQRDAEGYECRAEYSLVYRHLLGYTIFVPLGMTRSTGALAKQLEPDGTIDLPFRDGAHFQNEMRQLGLRGFGICGERVYEFGCCPRCGRVQASHRGGGQRFGPECTLPPVKGWRPR